MNVRIVLADDQALVRVGLGMILENEEDLAVVGEAENGARAVELASSLRPDVVLMDIQMPVMDGLEATRQIVGLPGESVPRILILTTFERDEYVFEALRAGASGFLLKNAPPEHLVDAVRVVAHGEALLAPSVTRRLIEEFARGSVPVKHAGALDRLTERERDVLRLLVRGLTNSEIADTLFVSEATVKSHVSNVLAKLELRDRVQAVVFAYENGLVQRGP